MPRKGPIQKREVVLDPVYGSALVTQLVNKVLERGKRGTAEHIVYAALDRLKDRTGNEQVAGLKKAIDNIRPQLEVRSRRVGGATYQVPVEIRGDRRLSLGVRWLVQSARKRNGKSMSEKLAAEFVDAMNGLGAAVKRREDTHKMAEANKAFSHFKW